MNKEEIISETNNILPKFENLIQDEKYQARGIFNSEAVLLISVINYFNVNLFIESGRARGYSTKLVSRFFKDKNNFKIISIDKDSRSPDAKYGENELKNSNNVELVYGNAENLICDYLDEDSVVFIDGPKGDKALLLASELIKNKKVKAIGIHDLHKNTFHRNICETLFNHLFFSDDLDFVEKFRFLDDKCWKILKEYGEAPYLRKGKQIKSYASTLGVILNNPNAINQRALLNYKEYLKQKEKIGIKKSLKEIIKRLFNFK